MVLRGFRLVGVSDIVQRLWYASLIVSIRPPFQRSLEGFTEYMINSTDETSIVSQVQHI